jgi:LysR family transcriptional regulator, chromosome initiation inhibitor
MHDPHHLAALAAVIDQGGFEAAARTLLVTQSAVSQRLRALEEAVGAPLVTRTRPPRLTAPGREVLRHWQQWLLVDQSLRAALQGQRSAQPTGTSVVRHTLAIAVNADSLSTWIVPALAPVVQAQALDLRLYADDQDHTLALMRDGAVMACVSTERRALQGATATRLGAMQYLCCAAPAFAARWFPHGITAHSAALAPAVVFDEKDDMHADFLRAATGVKQLGFPHHRVPSSDSFVRALVEGWGYGMVPRNQVATLLENVQLKDISGPHAISVTLYWHRWRIAAPLLDAVSESVLDAAAKGFPVGSATAAPARAIHRASRGAQHGKKRAAMTAAE